MKMEGPSQLLQVHATFEIKRIRTYETYTEQTISNT